jgi:lambda repressor-like predicted transcriptional regulator
MRKTDLSRFMQKTKRRGACLIWTAGKSPDGYGKFATGPNGGQTHHRAHRWIYSQLVGDPGPVLRHSCDTPECVEIKHLLPGTQKDNINDCIERGRFVRGSKNGLAKLTDKKVAKILKLRAAGVSLSDLSNRFGVIEAQICAITTGRSWKHVDGPRNVYVRRGSSKLNDAKVVELRRLHKEGWTYTALGKYFGVDRSQAANVATRKHWSHVPEGVPYWFGEWAEIIPVKEPRRVSADGNRDDASCCVVTNDKDLAQKIREAT